MVGRGGLAERLGELAGHLLGAGARARVDDRRQRVLAPQALGDQRALLVGRGPGDGERDVGPVEPRGHPQRVAQAEPLRHVGGHARRGRGGGRHERARAERPGGVREAEVVGPEVVAPLRDAVRLVDHEQPDARGAEALHEAARREALGRHVEQPQVARRRALERGGVGARLLLRVDERHAVAEAARLERLDLVLHQRHERRDDHREVVAQQAGQLVAERLARAGGHHHEHVAARQGGLAGLALARPELPESEELVE